MGNVRSLCVSGMRSNVVLLLPPALALLLAQYVALSWIATEVHSDYELCKPRENKNAWRGWQSGVCYTQEQLWCRKNGNRNVDCETAGCRAEEIRLTLHLLKPTEGANREKYHVLPARKSVYENSDACFQKIYDHLEAM